jgi:hypothetical protein
MRLRNPELWIQIGQCTSHRRKIGLVYLQAKGQSRAGVELIPRSPLNSDMTLAIARERKRQIRFQRIQSRFAVQMCEQNPNFLRESRKLTSHKACHKLSTPAVGLNFDFRVKPTFRPIRGKSSDRNVFAILPADQDHASVICVLGGLHKGVRSLRGCRC